MTLKISLQSKLIGLFLLVSILPLMVSSLFAFQNGQKTLRQRIGAELEKTAFETMDKIDRVILSRVLDMSAWSHIETMQDVTTDDRSARITEILVRWKEIYGFYSGIFGVNPQGLVVASSEIETIGQDVSSEFWFKRTATSLKTTVEDLQYDNLVGDRAIKLSIPIASSMDETQMIGVLSSRLSWQVFAEITNAVPVTEQGLTESGYVLLINRKGDIIAGPPFILEASEEVLSHRNLLSAGYRSAQEAVQGKKGFRIEKDPKGREFLIGYAGSRGYRDYEGLGWSILIFRETKEAFAPVVQFRNRSMGVVFATSFFVIILAVSFAKGIAMPLQRLGHLAGMIAKGDFSQKMKVESKDEIGTLASAFNKMAEDLQQTTVSRDSLLKEITERKRLEAAVLQSEKMAMAGQLAFGVAHEVKNPLAVLLQGVDYLRKHGKSDDSEVPQLLEDMTRAVERADYVVRGLLELGRPAAFDPKPANLDSIIESVLLLLKRQLDEGRIQVIKNCKADLPKVSVDRGRTLSLFVNLLSNAAEAMSNGGSITITVALQKLTEAGAHVGRRKEDVFKVGQEVVTIKVEDTGSGIPEDVLPHIFDPFFTTKRGKGGTGLGLSVARNIVQVHDGTIEITNRKEGGTCVIVMLPVG